MIMTTFNITYQIITPESAENGDYAETGFYLKNVNLREAFNAIDGCASEADTWPVSLNNPPRWFTGYVIEDRDYWELGQRETRSLHLPDSITPSSALRIAKLLGIT